MPNYRKPQFNRFEVIGNLTRDFEVKHLPSGTCLAQSCVASSRFYKQDGESKEEILFIDFKVFGGWAEKLSDTTRKGSAVLVEGHLKQEVWNDKDGKKQSRIVCIAERVQPLTWLDEDSRDAAPRSSGARTQSRQAELPPDDDIPF